MLNVSYKFDLPNTNKSIIKVIGVGGGGSNAVNHMFNQGIKDVEFVVCNTDIQALKSSPIPTKLQIGKDLTEGLGAGADPARGKNAAIESKEEIRTLLSQDTKMVFITAGMGGGTGTGAAPEIAKVARDLDILTVGIVTVPFGWEGKKKKLQAEQGIAELKQYCDTVLVIMNDKLKDVFGNLGIRDAFSKADNVLTNGARSIADIITVAGDVNIDFNDVRTVMKDAGTAVMGSGVASGTNRANRAIEEALSSPLLNNTDICGAKRILLSIAYGEQMEITMDEVGEITEYLAERAGGDDYDMIHGIAMDHHLGESIRVTVIATGFEIGEEKKPVPVFEAPVAAAPIVAPIISPVAEAPIIPPIHDAPIIPPIHDSANSNSTRTIVDLESGKSNTIPEPQAYTVIDRSEPQSPSSTEGNYTPPAMEDQSAREVRVEQTPNKSNSTVTFDLDSSYTVVEKNDAANVPAEKSVPQQTTLFNDFFQDNNQKQQLKEQQQDRLERLKNLSRNLQHAYNDPEEFRHRLDVPAFMRMGVTLDNTPHSSERNISRFNLNDDNEILGNNKFLHDNVD